MHSGVRHIIYVPCFTRARACVVHVQREVAYLSVLCILQSSLSTQPHFAANVPPCTALCYHGAHSTPAAPSFAPCPAPLGAAAAGLDIAGPGACSAPMGPVAAHFVPMHQQLARAAAWASRPGSRYGCCSMIPPPARALCVDHAVLCCVQAMCASHPRAGCTVGNMAAAVPSKLPRSTWPCSASGMPRAASAAYVLSCSSGGLQGHWSVCLSVFPVSAFHTRIASLGCCYLDNMSVICRILRPV